ncbi:MAG TPA: hypothetical protein VLA12_02855 [Planctomycetaceae bacterium]|nr:hypothetical protein [Planctomycetaceae bacterium]
MFAKSIHRACLAAATVAASASSPAWGQLFNDCCVPCVQPVAQTVYQTVPVTEYQRTKRTVMKPVNEVQYVDRQVTEYVPVTATKTAEVPVVNYQNVTEYRTVQQDMGGWVTHVEPIAKVAPCQYDARPTFGGWLNRTSYGIRSAFTPNYRTTRLYQPNIVTQSVPVTRQVAVRSTRQVTYNETRYEPRTTTRRVAVNTTKMVAVEEDVLQPVTVYRTVPTGTAITYAPYGTAITYAPLGITTSQTVLAPAPDPISGTRSADRSDPAKDASRTNNKKESGVPVKRSSNTTFEGDKDPFGSGPGASIRRTDEAQLSSVGSAKFPSVVRASGWRPTGSGPILNAPAIAGK